MSSINSPTDRKTKIVPRNEKLRQEVANIINSNIDTTPIIVNNVIRPVSPTLFQAESPVNEIVECFTPTINKNSNSPVNTIPIINNTVPIVNKNPSPFVTKNPSPVITKIATPVITKNPSPVITKIATPVVETIAKIPSPVKNEIVESPNTKTHRELVETSQRRRKGVVTISQKPLVVETPTTQEIIQNTKRIESPSTTKLIESPSIAKRIESPSTAKLIVPSSPLISQITTSPRQNPTKFVSRNRGVVSPSVVNDETIKIITLDGDTVTTPNKYLQTISPVVSEKNLPVVYDNERDNEVEFTT